MPTRLKTCRGAIANESGEEELYRRRLHGRDAAISVANRHKKTKIGYDDVHTAIDDCTRLAYSEVLPDGKNPTCAEFLNRAMTWFAAMAVCVRRILTDNAMVYRHGTAWAGVCSARDLKRCFTKPGCLWTNGKAERFNRTLLTNGPTPPLDQQRPAQTRP